MQTTLRRLGLAAAAILAASLPGFGPGAAADPQISTQAGFATIFRSPLPIEGLTADARGSYYTVGRGATGCPVWRLVRGAATLMGTIPAPCGPSGVTFDRAGKLYVADADRVWTLAPSTANPTATVFASGVPGANGLAFDRRGALWTGDGTTGQGRVWRIDAAGTATEVFRIQPLVNDVGVGRDVRSLPPGTVAVTPTSRNASDTAGSQHLVANGLAFGPDGSLYIADTARGAIWKVAFDRNGNVTNRRGCDAAFAPNTLCLDSVLAAHPYLEGVDGIALDRDGTVYAAANERNAIAVATRDGTVRELYRSAAAAGTRLRNGGPLEFPTSPFLFGTRLCVAQSDGNRRDNAPNSAGEAAPGTAVLGKVSCLTEPLARGGLPLPVR